MRKAYIKNTIRQTPCSSLPITRQFSLRVGGVATYNRVAFSLLKIKKPRELDLQFLSFIRKHLIGYYYLGAELEEEEICYLSSYQTPRPARAVEADFCRSPALGIN
jgi:hypothetical protein